MLYAILCYDSEEAVGAWTKEQDDTAMSKLAAVQDKLTKQGKLGPVARLMPTTAATTLRKGREALILDGPFAETKEQLLGFFVVDCEALDEVLEISKQLASCYTSTGAYEVRPIALFNPGASLR
jgi:hypothetical protein